jgi:peptidyl-prolyl cis-trans isomerase A (cyclophilin A)
LALAAFSVVIGCRNRPAPPEPERVVPATTQALVVSSAAVTAAPLQTAAPAAASAAAPSASAIASTAPSASAAAAPSGSAEPKVVPPGTDPEQGEFTLEEALKGLPKTGTLVAEIQTDAGKLKCNLYDDKAPITVANFVGLARGLRPFKDPKTREWVKRPAYDDGVFHRIIKGFMIQGGDPTGTGRSDGGYVFADEVWPGANHDRRGLICMANRGKNTNSMQFFILDGAAPHLNGGYTIFGECGPDSVIEKLAAAEVQGDRAVNPPKLKKVTIKRVK